MQLNRIIKNEENFINLLKNKEIHMVTPAYIGLTQCSTYLSNGCGMHLSQQEILVREVNEKREVGTLYPLHNMTLFPFRYQSSAFMMHSLVDYTNGNGYSDDDFRSFINDILLAEIKYIKSNRIIIDLAGCMEDSEKMRLFNLLGEEIQKEEYNESECLIEFKWDW
ncbi:hypothetical protein NMK71_04855 [Weeksellaceae bacterium KMM 9713]|uniref:Uncharacterized protein n=1 Tax=Profundicola chukchiensis TaxID=2961959 RepID=A0A9X4RVG5_9FLAO|nr:hypothetical protein [Profundicola chukchiensis]MDG4945735.1 hypothetical protein [Profundicola chukchiensis]